MNSQNTLIIKVLFVPLLALCACSESSHNEPSNSISTSQTSQKSRPIQRATTPSSHSTFASKPEIITDISDIYKTPQPSVRPRIQGKVIETMNSGGYTYVSIESSAGQILWAAGPQSFIKTGDILDVETNMEMNDFTSNTLGRTFKTIYFVSSFQKLASTRSTTTPKLKFPSLSKLSAKSHTPSDSHTSSTHVHESDHSGHTMPSITPATKISVVKAKDGYTIAELFAKSDLLAGKEVIVRGQVVKFNEGIMEKNWIHIQDGTGGLTTKNYDLTVTSDQITSVGKTVLIKGVLTKDKDIGAGYKYPVLLEQATFIK